LTAEGGAGTDFLGYGSLCNNLQCPKRPSFLPLNFIIIVH